MPTFSDDFNRADENLEASANWTRVDGVAGALGVRSNAMAQLNVTDTAYRSPDQGSTDHFTQATQASAVTAWGGFMCVKLTDSNNFIGIRWAGAGNGVDLFQRVGGGFLSLGNAGAATFNQGAVAYIETNAGNITVKADGVTKIGPTANANFPTITRGGFVSRSTTNPTLDLYSNGTLGGGGGGSAGKQPLLGIGP